MRSRIFNIYNLISLLIVPAVLWGFDFIFHLFIRWMPEPKIWITLLSISLPILAYFLVLKLYDRLAIRLSDIMFPEISGIIGFLYSQSAYAVLYMFLMNLTYKGKVLSLTEALKVVLLLTPIVPFSTIMVSTYDGTLIAVPLTCLAMILAGWRYRRKYKKSSLDNTGQSLNEKSGTL